MTSTSPSLAAPLYVDGPQIFTFALREVPGIVDRALQAAKRDADSVDYFSFHQADKFMLDRLIRKMRLPQDKCPYSIASYGNTSGASPAVTACHTIPEINRNREPGVMFIGFGVGYSWGGVLLRLRPGTVFHIESMPSPARPRRVG